MSLPVLIVMYHYVRPLAGRRWAGIKGLETQLFEEQLAYLQRHHVLVGLRDLVAARSGGSPLPPGAAILTFDDGYADHYQHVFPILRQAGIVGSFFPPASAVMERRMLNVNKIHFILASAADPGQLVPDVEEKIEAARGEFELLTLDAYRERLWVGSRFDPPEVIYLKRLLQAALPEPLRTRIADELFRVHVSDDEAGFADELYVGSAQLAEMAEAGMEIGSHGHAHYWLDSLDAAKQAEDIDRSLQLLDLIGVGRRDFLFCYPYGGYNRQTLEVLRARDCAAAVTTRVALARPAIDDLLELPRLDTNDIPKDASADPSSWTREALGQKSAAVID